MSKLIDIIITTKIKTSSALLCIVGSIVISWILAYTVELPPSVGLGVFIFWTYPVIIGIISIVFYLVLSWLLRKGQIIILVVSCVINLYCGLTLHLNPPLDSSLALAGDLHQQETYAYTLNLN